VTASFYCYMHLLYRQICLLYPSTHITVLGLIHPISSNRSPRRNLSVKVSIALSSETSTAEFLMMLHLCMYDLSVSLPCCMQASTSSIDDGRLYVDLKLLMNCFVSSS
jgi:hypothetical protein